MTIQVAYLATPGGQDAIALGARLAAEIKTGLHVVMVLPPQEVARRAPAQDYGQVLERQAQSWLAEAAQQAQELGPEQVSTQVLFSESVAHALIEQAEQAGADLLVVGGDGGGLAGLHSLGSVVNEILHSSGVPVALAPRGYRHHGRGGVQRITCAVGLRAGADQLLGFAAALARRSGASVRMLSLVALDRWPEAGPEPDRLEHAREHAQEIVERLRAGVPQDSPVDAEVVTGSSIENAIGRVEFDEGDLLVVGSSRLAQPRRLFLGSTAAKMLRTVRVPMIVVPADAENFGTTD